MAEIESTTTKLSGEAAAVGLELLGAGKNKHYRTYRFIPCGHEQEIVTACVRRRQFTCRACYEQRLNAEANLAGLDRLAAGRAKGVHRYRFLGCGHEQELQASKVRRGAIRCQTCLDNKHHAEANAVGLRLLAPARSTGNVLYRSYQFERCGHTQDIQPGSVRSNQFMCQLCGVSAWAEPAYVYSVKITVGEFSWFKIGYAKTIETRIKNYGLPAGAVVKIIKTELHLTAASAKQREADIHKALADRRLPTAQMRRYHTRSGATECFSILR